LEDFDGERSGTEPLPFIAMLIKSAEFVTSAFNPSQYPPAACPEIAFAGRSNVGKSSLINTLVNRKHLVKTSSTPGRTQMLNFFLINGAFHFVDLPGYGYAKVPARIKKRWGPMVETYLITRTTLCGLILIMDIRRIPGMEEVNFIHWLNEIGLANRLILTKTDKLSKSKQITQRRLTAGRLGVKPESLILFSAKTRLGRLDVWRGIEEMIEA
jgi:GTP-binding protein